MQTNTNQKTVRISLNEISPYRPVPYNTSNINFYTAVADHGPSLKPTMPQSERQSRFVTRTQPHLHNQSLALYNYEDPSKSHFYQQDVTRKVPAKRPQSAKKAPSVNKVVRDFELKAKFAQRQLQAYHASKATFQQSPQKSQQLQFCQTSENTPTQSYLKKQLIELYSKQNQSPLRSSPHTNENNLKDNSRFTQKHSQARHNCLSQQQTCSQTAHARSEFVLQEQVLNRRNETNYSPKASNSRFSLQQHSCVHCHGRRCCDCYSEKQTEMSAEKVFVRHLAQEQESDYRTPAQLIQPYTPQKKQVKSVQKSQTKSGRKFSQAEIEMGPGNYKDYRKFGDETRSYSIVGTRKSESKNDNPGPGFYNADQKLTKPTSIEVLIRRKHALFEQDPGIAPGEYEEHRQFGANMQPITIGRKNHSTLEKSVGPGEYAIEKADGLIKQNARQVAILPQSPAKNTEITLGPGQYDFLQKFGDGSKSQEFGKRYPQTVKEGPGPGYYSPERGDSQTKLQSRSAIFMHQTGRVEQETDPTCGPGTYEVRKNFGKGLQMMTIGRKQTSKSPNNKLGPGFYSPEKADPQTKKNSKLVDFGQSKGRVQQAGDADNGPGSYDVGYKFGSDLKDMKIGEKRVQKMEATIGPGTYDIDQADKVVRISPNRGVSFEKKIGREIREEDPMLGPGTYKTSIEFGKNIKPISIGRRPEPKTPEQKPGPGYYEPEKGDKLTMQQSQQFDFTKQQRRPESQVDPDNGPGSNLKDFNLWSSKNMTIGTKPKSKSPKRDPGPGYYSPEKSDPLTKTRIQTADFVNQSRRPEIIPDPNNGPGSYKNMYEFGSDLTGMRIGEKRQEKIEDRLGPGQYDPEKADQITKYTARATSFEKKIGRQQREESPELGPGTYNQNTGIGIDLNQMTIGRKPETQLPERQPGPGSYEVNQADTQTKLRSTAVDFTNQSARQDMNVDPNNGPGSYRVSSEFGHTLNKMTIGEKRENKVEDNFPAPGQYDVDTATQHVKPTTRSTNFALQTDRIESKNDLTPGPGQYLDNGEFAQNAKQVTIGVKRNEQHRDNLPGPGAYIPERADTITKQTVQSTEFEKVQGRIDQTTYTFIGPGTYDISNKFGSESKGQTIGEKRPLKVEQNQVGPGDYEIEKADEIVRHSERTVQFQNQTGRETVQIDSEIGPGAYQTQSEFGKDLKQMTIGRKTEPMSRDNNPGPGDYNVNDQITQPRTATVDFSNTIERTIPTCDPDLGPGSYEVHSEFGRSFNKMTIGEKRQISNRDPVPAPGEYNPDDLLVKPSSKTIDFQSSPGRRDVKQEQNPGPGSYKIHNEQSKGFLIGERRDVISPDQNPGPGSYEAQRSTIVTNQNVSSINFGLNSGREQIPQAEYPGPGAYALQTDFSGNLKQMTIGEKRGERIRDDIPGPGVYNPEDALTKPSAQEHSFAMSQRVEHKVEAEGGPGTYDVQGQFGNNTKGVTIGEKRQLKSPGNVPGPGNYNPESSLVKPSSRAFDFQMSPGREDAKQKQNPGPGFYEIHNEQSKGFLIGERREFISPDQNPGPGSYETDRAIIITKQNVPTVNFGLNSEREQIPSAEYPGPGAYALQTDFSGNLKQMTIGEKRQLKSPGNVPGPGQYDISELLTKYRTNALDFGSTKERSEPVYNPDLGPGSYLVQSDLGHSMHGMTIGERRQIISHDNVPAPGEYNQESQLVKPSSRAFDFSKNRGRVEVEQVQSPGPGTYEASKAIQLIKPTVNSQDFSITTGREEQKVDSNLGSGSFNHTSDFGQNMNGMTIGEKRQSRLPDQIPAPGQYNSESALELTKPSPQKVDFSRSPARLQQPQYEIPGDRAYDLEYDYKNSSKGFTIGERRPEIQLYQNPGPGSYSPEKADIIVKQRQVETDFHSSIHNLIRPEYQSISYDNLYKPKTSLTKPSSKAYKFVKTERMSPPQLYKSADKAYKGLVYREGAGDYRGVAYGTPTKTEIVQTRSFYDLHNSKPKLMTVIDEKSEMSPCSELKLQNKSSTSHMIRKYGYVPQTKKSATRK